MTIPSTDAAVLDPQGTRSTITALVISDVDFDPDETVDHLEVRTLESAPAALAALEEADCLVVSQASGMVDAAFLDHVRDHRPALPIVCIVDGSVSSPALTDGLEDDQWIDVVDADSGPSLCDHLRYRVPLLVERRRLTGVADRTLAGIELASDAIAIVDPDGTVQFVNRSFATLFETDRESLVGRSWQTIFPDETVERLESTAIPTVVDGWRWRGTCTCRRTTGTTFSASVRLDGLEDGSLVLVVEAQ